MFSGLAQILQQLDLLFYSHYAFYTAELLVTRMSTEYLSYAAHHCLACLLFYAFIREKNTYSAISLFPFLTHGFYWLNPGIIGFQNEMSILAVYNLSFLAAGLVGLVLAITSNGTRATFRLPFLSICIVSVNYYSYCGMLQQLYAKSLVDFFGQYCHRSSLFMTEDQFLGNKLLTLLMLISVVGPTIALSHYFKRVEQKSETSISVTKLEEEYNSSEDEAVSLPPKTFASGNVRLRK